MNVYVYRIRMFHVVTLLWLNIECSFSSDISSSFSLLLRFDQILLASKDTTNEGQMVGLIGGLYKNIHATTPNTKSIIRFISTLMLDEEKRRHNCFHLLIPGLWNKILKVSIWKVQIDECQGWQGLTVSFSCFFFSFKDTCRSRTDKIFINIFRKIW